MNYIIKLNGQQKQIKSNQFEATETRLYNQVLSVIDKYGSGEQPTKEQVLSYINGDAFEIGSSDYSMSIIESV